MEEQRKLHERGVFNLVSMWSKESGSVCESCRNKIAQTGWCKQNHLFSHSCGGWKSEIKTSVGLVSLAASLLCLQMAIFSLCPNVVFPLYMYVS